jgi:DNA-binding Xre family transcriptional regulator
MAVSYKKLWHLLIDKDLKKTELREMSGISPATMAKLTKGENVTTDILLRICKTLNCGISDIMEIVPDNDNIGEKK